jgi:hypothetical protein
VFAWNLLDLKRVKWRRPDALAAGKHTIVFDFKYDGLGFAAWIVRFRWYFRSTRRSISDRPPGTPVDDQDYQIPFAFTGRIDKLTFAIDPPKMTPEDEKKLSDAYRAAQDAN